MLRPGSPKPGRRTRDTEAEIRDVLENTGRLASLRNYRSFPVAQHRSTNIESESADGRSHYDDKIFSVLKRAGLLLVYSV